MKTRLGKVICMVLAVLMMFSLLTGCGKNGSTGSTTSSASTTEGKKTLDPVTLNFYFFGDPLTNQQSILDEFYARTKDTINAKLNFNWTPVADYKNKISVKLAAGEVLDSVFDAQWNQLPQMIAKSSYQKLDKYFYNDQYPGLKKAFPSNYLDNNKFADSTGKASVYGIPFTVDYGSVGGFVIRQDLREKYGLPPIKNTADLEAYFDAVLKNEGGKVIPLGTSLTQGLSNFIVDPAAQKTVYVTAGDGLYFKVIINSDNTVKLVTAGEDPTNIPNPDLQRKWYTKGYLEKDVMSQKDYMGLFKAGKFAAVVGLQNSVGQVYQETMKNIPGSKLEFVSINPDLAAHKQQALYSPFQAWNFACIPVSSKNADRTMMVFDWMFQDQKNHDLFELGKEGTDWVAVGSDKYKRPDGVDVSKVYNNTSAYELTWNPLFVRYDSNLPQSAVDVLKYAADMNTWKKSPLAGFTFNAEPVKDLVAKCAPEAKSFGSLADVGLIDNYQAQVEQLNEKLKKLGLEEIRAEMKKQVEAFLKNNK